MRAMHKGASQRKRKESQMAQVMHRLSRNKVAMAGLLVIALMVVLAFLSPWITPHDYMKMDMSKMHAGMSWQHPFGCDELGRDIFSRALYGARASLSLGLLSTLLATVIGLILGSLVGYFGGWVDTVIMRFLTSSRRSPACFCPLRFQRRSARALATRSSRCP